MEPNPAPPPIDPSQNQPQSAQYDFIVNPGAYKKKKLLSLPLPSGGSKGSRILVAVGGFVILMIVFIVGSSFMGKSDVARKEQLISVVAQQKELIRVAEIGVDKAKSVEARNLAITTSITLTSEQGELLDALKKLGVKTDSKTIGGKNSKTDQLLTEAEQANNFDEVFIKKLQEDLLKYAKAVQTAHKNNNSKNTKAALESQFKNAATLAGYKEE